MTADTTRAASPDLESLRALSDAATPGPWKWGGQVGQYVDLVTVGRGVLTVMGSKRLGMQGAEPVFWRRPPDAPWGWNGKREPASEVAVREVPYRDDIVDIDNPNAQLIVAAVNYLRAALRADQPLPIENAAIEGGWLAWDCPACGTRVSSLYRPPAVATRAETGLRERIEAATLLIRELAETVHQTGAIRDHVDRADKTGWNVHGIETCDDLLCVEALAWLATLTTPEPETDTP